MNSTYTLRLKKGWLMRLLPKTLLAQVALAILLVYIIIALLAALNLIAADWDYGVAGDEYLSPNTKYWMGTDFIGRSVSKKVIKGAQVAIQSGLTVASIAILLGTLPGCLAGYFGGWVDQLVLGVCNTVEAVPSIMLLIALNFLFQGNLLALYFGLALTSGTTLCRSVRAEVLQHKTKEYVQAATAIGAGQFYKLFIHIFPNVFHIVIIRFALIFQVAIKTEVILSYLGIGGCQVASWGHMIQDARSELLRGCWWQITFATLAMFLIVLAANLISDAIRDATDPKLQTA